MRSTTLNGWRSAAIILLAVCQVSSADHHGVHPSLARKHMHHLRQRHAPVVKRSTCEFPTDAGLVEVTPECQNAGWAMSPNQSCKPGTYCPYACPPGQLMAQWNPKATSYTYPLSMDGGLYCNEDGEIEKPFPNKPYCYDGQGTVSCKNEAHQPVAFCQTVLPGNEAMLIPTDVVSDATLAVPDTSYWAGTAAHYYINPPGVSSKEACVWGNKEKPVGNWSPYVAGANVDSKGETFVKLAWNPIYIEPDVPFRNEIPDWGVRIECDGPGCSGLPCEIDPNKHEVNQCSQDNPPGAGGATFCVVGVPKGVMSTIVVFPKSGGSSGGGYSKPKQTSHNDNEAAEKPPSYSSETPQRSSTISSTSTYSTSSSAVPSSSAHRTSTYSPPTVAPSTSTHISPTYIPSTYNSSTHISSTYIPSTPIFSTHTPSVYVPLAYNSSTQYSHNPGSMHVTSYPSATISGSVASATHNGTITTHEAPKPSDINVVEQGSLATSIAVPSFVLLVTFAGAAMLF